MLFMIIYKSSCQTGLVLVNSDQVFVVSHENRLCAVQHENNMAPC